MIEIKTDILRCKNSGGQWETVPAISTGVIQDGNTITIGDKVLTLHDDGSVTWSNIAI